MKLTSLLAGAAAAALIAGCTTISADAPPAPAPATVAAAPAAPPAPAPAAAPTVPVAGPVSATPEYVSIPMSIEINKPVADVWAKIGGWCDISKWITPTGGVPCEVKSSHSDVGSVRVIAGRVTEIMTAKSQFGYGYTQPPVEGKFYNLYHGFMEAVPASPTTTRINYTLVLDVSDKADQAAKDADVNGRRRQFEAALQNIKKLAEG
jgi:hypothetical protein